jgi:uncharacterized protein (DUF433 family)
MTSRIVSNPNILGGKPCVKGTRIPVYMGTGACRSRYYLQ